MEGWDPNTKSTLTQIPLLTTKAGPRNGAAWTQRLKEESSLSVGRSSPRRSPLLSLPVARALASPPLSLVATALPHRRSPSPRRRSLSPVISFGCFIRLDLR